MSLDRFHPAVASWFSTNLGAPTACQAQAWEAVAAGRHTLIAAPTGSGKTLAGFLTAIDALVRDSRLAPLPDATRVLYVSPLKALGNDVHKNLEVPLEGIDRALAEAGEPGSGIRAMVRTGDTPSAARDAMRRHPPHILVTTPESLYILLTSEGGRAMLASTGTAIVDEIHAVAGNKRGAHLALSLERLDALAGRPVTRIGLSATQRPIETVAHFLTGCEAGTPRACTIVDTGHTRERDLALELPDSPLEAVMSGEVWAEVYQRLRALIEAHRTTLVFVNTRRMAERVARALSESLGEEHVTSHHGSLSRERRLAAEQRLKAGDLKALVATASLELGIDIGDVDLVCQLGSTRSISTFLQRAGRSGHAVHGTPKGRLFPLTRDELVECAALLDAVRRGELDTLHVPAHPLDVLAQQTVAMVAAEDWSEDALLTAVRRAWPYRDLARERWREILAMLAGGFSTRRGRRAAYLHRDVVNGELRARRGARLTAMTSGGAIPDNADYDVVLEPHGAYLGSLNEDFAIESLPGDIFQLGNTSWRILRIERGSVRVEDAHGQPPNLPFWLGEAPGRTAELSDSVCDLLGWLAQRFEAAGADADEAGATTARDIATEAARARATETSETAAETAGARTTGTGETAAEAVEARTTGTGETAAEAVEARTTGTGETAAEAVEARTTGTGETAAEAVEARTTGTGETAAEAVEARTTGTGETAAEAVEARTTGTGETAAEAVEARTTGTGETDARGAGHHAAGTGVATPQARGRIARELAGRAGIGAEASARIVDYLCTAHAALGALPDRDTVVLERFFDESGGMQLVVHSRFGSRLNRAWGLALRKRFCRKFNFELQAAATEDAIVLSLGESHSFALEEVVRYLSPETVRDVLTQALLDAPMFEVRWRWNANVALAIPRFRGGGKVPPNIQRMQAEDLIAAVFPDQIACVENLAGPRAIPDHPLVEQTIADALTDAMDVEGLEALVGRLAGGEIRVVARDLTEPSPLAAEVLDARPYAFLDDAPLEERRTRAVTMRRGLDPASAADIGRLDPDAIDRVREEAWPRVATPDELHDALVVLGFATAAEGMTGRYGAAAGTAGTATAGVVANATGTATGSAMAGAAGTAAGRATAGTVGTTAGNPAAGTAGTTAGRATAGAAGTAAGSVATGVAGTAAGSAVAGTVGTTAGNPVAGAAGTAAGRVAAGATRTAAERATDLASAARRFAAGERPGWSAHFDALAASGRATRFRAPRGGPVLWCAAEHLALLEAALPGGRADPPLALPEELRRAPGRDAALAELVRARLGCLGPVTAAQLAGDLGAAPVEIEVALVALEAEGCVLRGRFTPGAASGEWCDRRLLARIHRYTLGRLRREIEPATRAELMRFLVEWQRVRPDDRREGDEALAAVVAELEGFAAPAAAWEADILPARLAGFTSDMLDRLCLAGRASWARPAPPIRETPGRSFGPIASTPIALFSRQGRRRAPLWLARAGANTERAAGLRPAPRSMPPAHVGAGDPTVRRAAPERAELVRAKGGAGRNAGRATAPTLDTGQDDMSEPGVSEPGVSEPGVSEPDGPEDAGASGATPLSPAARGVLAYLAARGASFFDDVVAETGARAPDAAAALGELIAHGLVSADGFAGLRAFTGASARRLRAVAEAGRWSCVARRAADAADAPAVGDDGVEAIARTLLRRYGVVFKALLARESFGVPWRELLRELRRLEARGEIRGGRFVAGFTGEQYALPEAVETLRRVRRAPANGAIVTVGAADPLNLTGIVCLGKRVPATASVRIAFRDGVPIGTLTGRRKIDWIEPQTPEQEWSARNALLRRHIPALPAARPV